MNVSDLNENQKKAVTHPDGPLMIIAGAGTGKTKVITSRIAWLVETGRARPGEILALTFTEKAAAEMGERLEKLLGHQALSVTCATFHGFAQQLISRYGLEIGVTPGAPLLSEVQLWLLVHREFARFDFLKYYKPHGNPTKFIRALVRHFLRAKDENISPAAYAAEAERIKLEAGTVDGPLSEEAARVGELARAYAVYDALLRERGLMDFGDLLRYAHAIVSGRANIRARLQQQYKYIVVDEFQDTNMAQYDLVCALVGDAQNITVVGDDDQAIYKFRGASVDNILKFREKFSVRTEVFLTENYRSTQEILDAAYTLIQFNNPFRLETNGEKKLRAARGGGVAVRTENFETGVQEARYIADEISEAIAAGTAPHDIAVLVRASSHLEEVAAALLRQKIPFAIAETAALLKTRPAIDLISMMRVVLERYHNNGWYQVCVSRISRLSPGGLVECIAWGRRKNVQLAKVLLGEFPPDLSDEDKTALIDLTARVKLEADAIRTNKGSVIAYELLEKSGYFKALLAEIETGSADGLSDMQRLSELLEFIANWETQHPGSTPYEFLADADRLLELGEEGQQNSGGAQEGAVQLLTIHSSKGLEFSRVFVVSAIEGRFPGTERSDGIELPEGLIRETAVPDDHHMQEERRLCYVAFTRARDVLTVSAATSYSASENARKRKPSRFISEAGLVMMENAAPEEITVSFATTSPVPQNMAVQTRAKEELSFTQLQTFERCPYQYWFAHVLRMPIASKWTMNFGKSIHAALQQWYELLKEGQSVKQISLFDAAPQSAPAVPPVTTLTDILRRAWISEGYPTKKFEDEKKADAEKMLREYYRQHENAWTMPAYIEQRFRLVIGGEVMKGSIDRLDVLPDGTIEIIDYKTGTPKTSEDLKFQDKEQLLVYHLAAQRGLQLTPTLLSYYYVQNNTKASFEPKEKDLKKIEDSVGETAAAIKISNFKATPSPHVCGNCDFKDICPYREL